MVRTFPYLLLPHVWAARNRTRRRERGDFMRSLLFGGIGVAVFAALFSASSWLAGHLLDYEELGEYLLRIGLSWVFLTFLSFLAFSGIVTALSTFFLSDDLRLLVVAPVASHRLFHARFLRTLVQSSWMVVIFLVPVLVGVGYARCAGPMYYATALLTIVPFAVIPVAIGTAITLLLVNVFPARRARDILLLMGLVFAASLVVVLRFIRPERLLRVESLPDVTGFFATLQSPITPFLPSFWAGETIFASLSGGRDLVHAAALWTTAAASIVMVGYACERWHFSGYSRSQEAPKARFAHFRLLDVLVNALPFSIVRRQLLLRDLKIFLRDVTQWSQLLLLLALVLLYLYNFSVLDLTRIPYMSGFLKNIYAFVNLGMAGLVMATVTVRFVFPAVSAEGSAFWIIRTAPITASDFLWSKFWSGLVPVLFLTELLTIAANEFLAVDPLLKMMSALAIALMSFALVARAIAMGTLYPRFSSNPTEIAGSYGGVAFMVQAVLFVIVVITLLGWPASAYLFAQMRNRGLSSTQELMMTASVSSAIILSIAMWWLSMREAVRAMNRMGD
jgi:ABC-2 type transport system permease protein